MSVTAIRKSDTVEEVREKVAKSAIASRGLDAWKYCGKLKLTVPPGRYQANMRSEWGEPPR
jgi:hypothetical protein